MDSYHIIGGKKLAGEYALSGAKNAVLPILAATIITGRTSTIHNSPDLSDVRNMLTILEEIGCRVSWEGSDITIDTGGIHTCTIPDRLMREMRSSVFLMGPLLARCGQVTLSYPGGCEIGQRPVDIHLSALRKMGVEIEEGGGLLLCKANKLQGASLRLDFPSVGATENIMMAAVAAEGETRIINAAREPEISDLQNYLNSCGAQVEGAGKSEIVICGRGGQYPWNEVEHTVIPDRIEGGTILAAAAATGGEVLLTKANPSHMEILLGKLEETGCVIREEADSIWLKAPEKLIACESVKTQPHPGFPTDMQSQFLALMTKAEGTCVITETIFENRFRHVDALMKMGAKIRVEGRTAVVTGVERLTGALVPAKDLRGGAAMVIAGLAAEGETIVENICYIDRGYDKFESKLQRLGAQIQRINR